MAPPASRITILKPEDLDDAQRSVHDAIASGPRGVVRGPALLWLHSPEYAARIQSVGAYLRYDTVFDARLSELAILLTARHYTCHYIWYQHSRIAREVGLSEDLINAIRDRTTPAFEHRDETAVYRFATEMLETNRVRDATLAEIKSLFGDRGAIELGAIIGHYHLGAITLATAELELPDGTTTLLPE